MIARLFHADLWGGRDDKYRWLLEYDVENTPWTELSPASPMYLFKPQDAGLRAEYERGWKLTDILPLYGVGLTTARDHVVIDFEEAPLLERARLFRDSRESDAELCRSLGIPQKKGWNIPHARRLLQMETDLHQFIQPILYRPFDERLVFYHDSLVWRTVRRVMHHMVAGLNLGLAVGRAGQVIGSHEWDIILVSTLPTEFNFYRRGGNNLFPLWLYSGAGQVDPELLEHWPAGRDGRRPNLAPGFVSQLEHAMGLSFVSDGAGDLGRTLGPEDVFNHIYAVLHAPSYRQRYAEFLRLDFPRIPLPTSSDRFAALARLGGQLVALHLLESPAVRNLITTFPVPGDNTVERGHPKYLAPGAPDPRTGETLRAGRVYISKDALRANRRGQYFEGVPHTVWEFHIGGYQVCEKWLKDRRGRALSHDELTRYQQILVALAETIRLMAEIDRVIAVGGGWSAS